MYAERLAQRGYELILVARSADNLNAVAAKIGRHRVETIAADLTQEHDLHALERRLREDPAITMLVNNAASTQNTSFVNASPDALERIIDLNVTALVRLSHAAATSFVVKRAGAIVNIGSGVVMMPDQYNAAYGASKAFVLAFTRNLAAELEPQGIRVQVVLPGLIATEALKRYGLDMSTLPEPMPTDVMVDAALAGLNQGEVITFPSLASLTSWEAMEQARLALIPQVFDAAPAPRYRANQ